MSYLPLRSNPEFRENLERAARMGETDRIRQTKETVHAKASALLGRAKSEARELTKEENFAYSEMLGDMQFLNTMIDESVSGGRRIAKAFELVHRAEGMGDALEWQRVRSISNYEFKIPMGEILQRTHKKTATERRDFLTSTATTIPTQILDELTTRLQQDSGVLAAGPRIINTESQGGYTLKANQFSALSTAAVVTEGSAFAESDPTVTTITFQAFKFGQLFQVSNELLQDAFFDIESFFGEQLSTAVAQTIAPVLVTGSGTATCQGILNAVTTGVTSGTAVSGVPTYANLISLYGSLPSQYRANSSFIMNPSTLTTIAGLLDTQNRSLLLPSLSGDVPTTLFGRPVYLDSNMPATGLSAKSIWYGDMRNFYAVRFAERLTIDASKDYAFNQDLMTYRIKQRLDARIFDSNAARVFVGAAT